MLRSYVVVIGLWLLACICVRGGAVTVEHERKGTVWGIYGLGFRVALVLATSFGLCSSQKRMLGHVGNAFGMFCFGFFCHKLREKVQGIF